MKNQARDQLIDEIKRQHIELLDANCDRIVAAYEDAIQEHDSDMKFKFPITVKSDITGVDPEDYKIDSALSVNVKYKDTRSELVKTGHDMVDQMNAAEANAAATDGPEPLPADPPEAVVLFAPATTKRALNHQTAISNRLRARGFVADEEAKEWTKANPTADDRRYLATLADDKDVEEIRF